MVQKQKLKIHKVKIQDQGLNQKKQNREIKQWAIDGHHPEEQNQWLSKRKITLTPFFTVISNIFLKPKIENDSHTSAYFPVHVGPKRGCLPFWCHFTKKIMWDLALNILSSFFLATIWKGNVSGYKRGKITLMPPFPSIVVVATGSFYCCCILFSRLFTLLQILIDPFHAFVSL